MANRQQIEFIIRLNGQVEERVSGVKGRDCERITRPIETALGEVTEREHTGEYYEQGVRTRPDVRRRGT